MPSTTLIIGGCRSGKSNHAIKLADQINGQKKIFVATCIPEDEEMAARVHRHQLERGPHWQTVEAPRDLAEAITRQSGGANVILIDCLTLWISNLMMAHDDNAVILDQIERFSIALTNAHCPVIAVSNEVGTGIVPENPLARRFRDLSGWCNQAMAATCSRVIWMVAGIAVDIKGTS